MLVNQTVIKGVKIWLELQGYTYYVSLKDKEGNKATAEIISDKIEHKLQFKHIDDTLYDKVDWKKLIFWISQSIQDYERRKNKRDLKHQIKEQLKRGSTFGIDL